MEGLSFWNNWAKDYRWLWYVLSILFIGSIALVWYYYFVGSSAIISWEKIQEQKVVETTIHSFKMGPFELSVPSESYVIFEFLGGTGIQHNAFISIVFITVFFTCCVILLSIITTLDKFWYFAGMAVFILFLISLRLDVLRVRGTSGYMMPIIALILFLGTSFYFRFLKPYTSFLIRIGVFGLITILLSVLIVMLSGVNSPLLHVVVTAYTPALILTMLFLIMVSHEILVGLVYITNQGTAGKNVGHFSLIAFIYIVNVIITCLYEIGGINWNFIYINLFLLATVSGVLGVWGFRIREPLYENILPFSPFGAFFFVALGSICFITIAQLLGNGNDAAVKLVRYIIIFSHAGFGITFIIYFFSNFLVMMGNNIRVYNLLYKPNRMPYFTFRFAGVIASLAFLFYSNWRDFVDHGLAGFYNYVADMQLAEGDESLATTFYEQSRSLSFQNHRANYQLATMKTDRMNFEGAITNYRLANGKRPSEFSLANEGNVHLWTGQYFDGLATFRKALDVLPKSEIIQNNLGYGFLKVHNLDSAGYYLSNARSNDFTKSTAEGNFMAMTATEFIPIDADSIFKYFETDHALVKANALAVATLFKQEIDIKSDSIYTKPLNLYEATFLNNYINYNVKSLDTAFMTRIFRVASDSANLNYREALKASLAHAFYHQGKVFKALDILGELAYISQSHQGKFNYIMGLWTLEQGAPEVAATYFTYAETAEYKLGRFYKAISLTEAGKTNEALMTWDSITSKNEEPLKTLGANITKILYTTPSQALTLSDPEKYQYCRYNVRLGDSALFKNLVRTFTNDNYKAQALLDFARKFFHADRITTAIQYFNQTAGLKLTDEKLYNDIRHFELLMLASRKEINGLAKQINNNITFGTGQQLHKILYTALINEASGDQLNAEKNYEILATANPFFEDGILAAADFFRRKDAAGQKSYDMLVNSIYVNPNSLRLLKAYATEAFRKGFDEYAMSATQRAQELEQAKY